MADVNIDLDSKDSKQLFTQGVRAFVLRDYKNAVDALSRATELMVTELGDHLHDDLGDPYLYYGKALLALFRQESDLIANLPQQLEETTMEDQEAEEEEDEEAENEENEAKDETEEVDEKTNGDEKKNGDANETEDGEDALKVDEADKNGAGPTNESFLELDPAEPEADEETTDMQVAWENLELARKIFQKRGEEGRKNYSETLTTLGEISMESENFQAAIDDFKEALEVQIQIYPEDSRKVAETFYNLGLAYASNTCYKEAVAYLKKSVEYLEKRIRNLEYKKENPEEVKEMRDLIPEIYEKIRDLQSFTDETKKKLEELTKQPELANKILEGASSSSSSKQASDISHLVKRKRKTEENEECNPAKK